MSVLLIVLAALGSGTSAEGADSLLALAEFEESEAMYTAADSLYLLAFTEYTVVGDLGMADLCRNSSYRMNRITVEYPLDREQADSLFSFRCPWLTDAERNFYFESDMVDCMEFDGSVYYFESCIPNILYRDLHLMHELGRRRNSGDIFFDALEDIIFRLPGSGYPHRAWQPEINPLTFMVDGSMTIPREELPESGVLYLWIPVPIQSSDQADPRVLSVVPAEYVDYPPTMDRELGTIYMEIPLDSLEGDLTCSVSTIHTHFERRCIVDPEKVGSYDTEDIEYIKYTGQNPNIEVTPSIRALADGIVGSEENPYLQARMLYYYIVENIPYSFVPHVSIAARGIPESAYCHEYGYGDCGMQSMYFCALCRSLGIPARACGGFQLVPGAEGAHFWAEFMIPGYGWIPVDVTVAETADWSWCLSDSEMQVFKDYFFGNLDPYRMVVQKDVSVPLSPLPVEPVAFATAIQFPAAVCVESMVDVSFITARYWRFSVTPVQR